MTRRQNTPLQTTFPAWTACILATTLAQPTLGVEPDVAQAMVKHMLAARQSQTPIPHLATTYGSFSDAEAYEIQAMLAKGLSRTWGPVVAYKVGYASKAAQKQFGMKGPASGTMCLLHRVPSGSHLPSESIMEVMLETEVAFTLGRRINRPIRNVDELKPYVKWVHTAFDVSEGRFAPAESNPTPQDMIASGLGAHFFVLGPAVDPKSVDLDSYMLRLVRNGQLVNESKATNVMGSPWNSLLWFVNHQIGLGSVLKPGTVVVSGTAAPAYRATGDQIKGDYVGECGALGKVSLTID